MQKFDCLAPSISLSGAHLLEASAGTGKTFAIEHLVARLLMSEEPLIDLSQILVVTFTRAATRELKFRIRSNLTKILESPPKEWSYLANFSEKTKRRIEDFLGVFEESQIFTIHGFSQQMLQLYALEASFSFSPQKELPIEKLEIAFKHFFDSELSSVMISPEQLTIVYRWAGSIKELVLKLKQSQTMGQKKPFEAQWQKFQQTIQKWPGEAFDSDAFQHSFQEIRKSYKAAIKGDFESQIRALGRAFSEPENPLSFRRLIKEKGSIFSFLSSENQKVRAKTTVNLPFFEWGREHLLPLISEAASPKQIFQTLLSYWKPIQEKLMEEEAVIDPDQLLKKMGEAIQNPVFRQKVQDRYKAVLIDEFQDTDPLQWKIFQTLFLNSSHVLYLVGDPKQSIYRFRGADLYTYLEAKRAIEPQKHFYLDTNFRSSAKLMDGLNHLFDRSWLKLPKWSQSLPFLRTKAGIDLPDLFDDEKKGVHCLLFAEEKALLLYIATEIILLHKNTSSFSSFAILVKDRYQGSRIEELFASFGIPSLFRNQESLFETAAFQAVEELLDCLAHPKDLKKAKAVLAGPFGGFSQEELLKIESSPFLELSSLLKEKGLASMFCSLLDLQLKNSSAQEKIGCQGASFVSEFHQVVEFLLDWERTNGFSFERFFNFLSISQTLNPEQQPRRQRESGIDAVHIMTMHASKGLEFDVVFALGVSASSSEEEDEEIRAEKLRQFYVTLTRAKRRVYLPIPKNQEKQDTSPIELFCQILAPEGNWEEHLRILSQKTDLSIEVVEPTFALPSLEIKAKISLPSEKPFFRVNPSYLLSFTSLAQTKSVLTKEHEKIDVKPLYIPPGSDTGIMIHQIFQRIFAEKKWRFAEEIQKIIDEEVEETSFLPWKEAIQELIEKTLSFPLPIGFSLKELGSEELLVETEFFLQEGANFVKGFIDLVFIHEQKLYFVDWKTNWLGESCADYSLERLEEVMLTNQYHLQASIYAKALKKSCGHLSFGGAIYLFVRGPNAVCFIPEEYERT